MIVRAPLNSVLLEGVRSAEPPKISGSAGAMMFSTACEDCRVACGASASSRSLQSLRRGVAPALRQLARDAPLEFARQLRDAPSDSGRRARARPTSAAAPCGGGPTAARSSSGITNGS